MATEVDEDSDGILGYGLIGGLLANMQHMQPDGPQRRIVNEASHRADKANAPDSPVSAV